MWHLRLAFTQMISASTDYTRFVFVWSQRQQNNNTTVATVTNTASTTKNDKLSCVLDHIHIKFTNFVHWMDRTIAQPPTNDKFLANLERKNIKYFSYSLFHHRVQFHSHTSTTYTSYVCVCVLIPCIPSLYYDVI